MTFQYFTPRNGNGVVKLLEALPYMIDDDGPYKLIVSNCEIKDSDERPMIDFYFDKDDNFFYFARTGGFPELVTREEIISMARCGIAWI